MTSSSALETTSPKNPEASSKKVRPHHVIAPRFRPWIQVDVSVSGSAPISVAPVAPALVLPLAGEVPQWPARPVRRPGDGGA